jgi:hypothetical protein
MWISSLADSIMTTTALRPPYVFAPVRLQHTSLRCDSFTCRMIVDKVASRGLEVQVFGQVGLENDLIDELKVVPHFRVGTYEQGRFHQDPVAGWIRDFEHASYLTLADFQRLPAMALEDIVYVNSALPCQLKCTLTWLTEPPSQRPKVFVELGVEPGTRLPPRRSCESCTVVLHGCYQALHTFQITFAPRFALAGRNRA